MTSGSRPGVAAAGTAAAIRVSDQNKMMFIYPALKQAV